MAKFLFFALVLDAAVEALDWVHRLYSADESITVLKSLAAGKLFYTLLVGQAALGTAVPLILLGITVVFTKKIQFINRKRIYLTSAVLILIGVLAMRYNVVIGGQLFSKSLRGFTSYKLEFAGHEGWLSALFLMILPFIITGILVKLFLPTGEKNEHHTGISPSQARSHATI
ncbi:MAG: hypothetical protein ACPMAG_05425 [Limisphaerales bacterium]